MENLEQSVNDVSEAPSPSTESTSSPKVENVTQQETSSNQSKQEPPFHEHPRFKELINQRNEFSKRLQEYENRFKELDGKIQQSAPKAATPESKLLERLKGIDPEFGSFMESQHAMRAQLEAKLQAMEQWKSAQEAASTRTQITNSLQQLHTQHKVPEPMRELYEAALEREARNNPHLSLNDLPQVYKAIHDKVNSQFESIKRETLASYSQAKTKDASIPSAPKGPSPKPGTPKPEYSKNPEEARAQIVRNTMKSLRSQ